MIMTYAMTSITAIEGLFLCALVVGGPLFGFLALYRTTQATAVPFLFGTFAAYGGWFVSGIAVLVLHPNYPFHQPAESISVLYILPGILSGYLGLRFLDRITATGTPEPTIALATANLLSQKSSCVEGVVGENHVTARSFHR